MNTKSSGALLAVLVVLIVGAIIWGRAQKNKTDGETATPVMSVVAYNKTQNTNATSVEARSSDEIVFTLTAENQSDKVISGYVMEANIADLSTHATLTDAGGASYNSATNSLVWTPLDINPNESIEKKIIARVNPLAVGTTNDVMKTKFNNEVSIQITNKTAASNAINPGKVAGVNNDLYKAPTTGPKESLLLVLAAFSTVAFWLMKRYSAAKA